MNYKVFTDGAVDFEKKILGLSYIIVTDDRFIKLNQFHTNGASATRAEVIAVGLACEYLLSNIYFSEEDVVTFYIDSKDAVSYLTGVSPDIFNNNDARITGSLNNFNVLSKKVCVETKKCWSHRNQSLTGNKLADRLADYALKE